MKILYRDPTTGDLCIVCPTGNLPIEDVCKKDVPAGAEYLVVEDNVIPTDRSFRNAWEADFSNPDGTGLGSDAYFEAKAKEVVSNDSEEVSNDNG